MPAWRPRNLAFEQWRQPRLLLYLSSNRNTLDLIERDLIAGTIIELGCARAFMRGHGLRVFQRDTGFEIRSNARRAENVAAELALQASLCRAPPDHLIGIHAMHGAVRKHPGSAGRRAEEGSLAVLADPGRSEILVEELLKLVMRRHFVALAAFLVQPQPPALASGVIVLDAHGDDGADAGKTVDHHADQRAIAQTDERREVNAVEKMAGLFFRQHRRLATAHDVLGPTHSMGRIDRENLADDEPIKQHADGREVLFDGRLGGRGLK